MLKVSELKRRVGIIVNKSPIKPLFDIGNLLLFHWSDRQIISHPGKDERKVLVIRPQTNTQGLLSTYLYVLKYVRWAILNRMTVYVDFESSKCQYYTGRSIHGSKNAWEYYFEQPSTICRSSLDTAGTVVYSGWTLNKDKPAPIPKRPEVSLDPEIVSIAKTFCPVKQYILDIANEKYRNLFLGRVLGVFLRGTDYVRMEPKGHARQPSLKDVIAKIDDFLCKYVIDWIFVVTEDLSYYSELKRRYGNIIISSDDYYVDYKSGDGYVGEVFTNDAYIRGLNYLVRILLFGRCDYVISGITNGSVVANLLKEKEPIESYWFDLGLY